MEPGELVEMIEDVESEFGKGFRQGPGSPEWIKQLVTDPEDSAYQRISKDEFLEMKVEIGTAKGSKFTYEDMVKKTVQWAREDDLEVEGSEESESDDMKCSEVSASSEEYYGTERQAASHRRRKKERADFTQLLQGLSMSVIGARS